MPRAAGSMSLRIITLLVLLLLPVASIFEIVKAATTATTLNQAISAGTLGVAIVDAGGVVVGSPSITFGSVSFNFAAQNATGTLGVPAQKIRLDNPTATAVWSITMAATGGNAAVWTNGASLTYPYNNATADNGRLTVDPSASTITPWGSCVNTNISKGTSDFFIIATPSIDLITAAAGTSTYCRWDLTSVSLTQRIPASQAVASYSIAMTITAL